MADRTQTFRSRVVLMAVAGVLWALGLSMRLGDLQIRKQDFLREKAEAQQERVIRLEPMRGFIFDRRGEVLAASSEVQSVFASPAEVKDAAATARILAATIGGDPDRYAQRLRGRGAFTWIRRKVAPEEAKRLRERLPSGVYMMPESQRLYPKGTLAAHVLGYVGLDGTGLAGLEQHYDRFIQGSPGLMLALRDARGSQYRRWVRRPPVHGMDLTLTLDEVVQHIAEREVERCMRETGARGAMAIVLDPCTGKLLGLANAPTFDPNAFQTCTPESMRNRAILDAYEPGSTFKTITAASALDRGLVRPEEQVFCENGAITVARKRIRDHDAYGWLAFHEVISKSSNVGAIKVGLRIPPDAFYKDVTSFGFGHRTGVDLPGENPGLLEPPERWSGLTQASMSMGQEVGATPLQMVLAVSVIGNGGTLYRPYVVDRITGPDGTVWMRNQPKVAGQPISSATATVLADILKGVVTEGTGKAATIEGIEVAGKTGTAEKAGERGYARGKYVASFVGFVPARAPRLAIGVFVDEPHGKHFGGQVAAPVFKRIAEPVLRTMGIPVGIVAGEGEEMVEAAAAGGQELVRVYVPEVKRERSSSGLSMPLHLRPPVSVGWERNPQDFAKGGKDVPTLATEAAAPPVEPGRVPDLMGQSVRDAVRILASAGLDLVAEGSGVAVRQDPPPGSLLPGREPVTVTFEGG